MRITVKGRNIEITDAIRAYAEEKIGKVVVAIEKDDVLKNRMLKESNEVMPVEVDGEDYLEEDQPEEIVN